MHTQLREPVGWGSVMACLLSFGIMPLDSLLLGAQNVKSPLCHFQVGD